jgi:hypothetical protein
MDRSLRIVVALAWITVVSTALAREVAGDTAAPHSVPVRESGWIEGLQVPYPDRHVRYFRHAFRLPADGTTALRITGRLPDARYVVFNLYTQSDRSSIGRLSDASLVSEAHDRGRLEPGDRFTIWVTPPGRSDLANRIVLPRDAQADTVYELWYRLYLPRHDDTGGLPLPEITLVDLVSGEERPPAAPVALVEMRPQTMRDWRKLPPRPDAEGRFAFYLKSGVGDFNNGDNQYLAARLDFAHGRSYALVRFRAPTFGLPSDGEPLPDVRYFSFCIGGGRLAGTSASIADEEMRLASGGDSYLLVGPRRERGIDVAALCRERGINFLEKEKAFVPVLIFRHVLPRPGFPGLSDPRYAWPYEADDLSPEEAVERCAQHRVIGDYSPSGRHLTLEEALAWIESQE